MKGREPAFLRWLALAALVDWLVTRTLARAAIFMPKAPPILIVYRALILGGQVASVLAALLALLGMSWLAWHFWKAHKGLLSLGLLGFAVSSLVSLVIPPGGLIRLLVHLLNLAAILWIGSETWRRASDITSRIAVLLVILALLSGGLYQASQILYVVFSLPGVPGFALGLFNLGELFVVLAPLGMWWAHRTRGYDSSTYLLIPPPPTPSPIIGGGENSRKLGLCGGEAPCISPISGIFPPLPSQGRGDKGGWVSNSSSTVVPSPGEGADSPWRDSARWWRSIASPLLAAIPAIGYSALTLTNPSMAGILAIWSTGLTLYLPWPLYALSLWLFGVTFLALRRQNHPAAWALLSLAAGGYAPQLSSQAFFGLIGLSLFTIHLPQSDTTTVQTRVSSFPQGVAEVS